MDSDDISSLALRAQSLFEQRHFKDGRPLLFKAIKILDESHEVDETWFQFRDSVGDIFYRAKSFGDSSGVDRMTLGIWSDNDFPESKQTLDLRLRLAEALCELGSPYVDEAISSLTKSIAFIEEQGWIEDYRAMYEALSRAYHILGREDEALRAASRWGQACELQQLLSEVRGAPKWNASNENLILALMKKCDNMLVILSNLQLANDIFFKSGNRDIRAYLGNQRSRVRADALKRRHTVQIQEVVDTTLDEPNRTAHKHETQQGQRSQTFAVEPNVTFARADSSPAATSHRYTSQRSGSYPKMPNLDEEQPTATSKTRTPSTGQQSSVLEGESVSAVGWTEQGSSRPSTPDSCAPSVEPHGTPRPSQRTGILLTATEKT